MTFGSLFTGIGGMDLGLERAGMECKWQVEIDQFCQRILTRHWPEVKKYGDITAIAAGELEPVDAIVGGFPCQDVSQIGHQAGIEGLRSGLFSEQIRLVCELRPKFVLLENVTGLLDRGMGEVLGALAEIGYDAEWECIQAATFGSPHKRERVFIVAYPDSIGRQAGEILNSLPKKSMDQWREWDSIKADLHPWDGNRGFLESSPYRELFGLDDGLPSEVALRGYGNAVVPQVAEWIGRRIIEANL